MTEVAWEIRASRALEAPDRDLDRTIAHLLGTARVNQGHLDVHLAAAAESVKDRALLAHHLHHAADHAAATWDHLVKLREAVSRRVPAVAGQLEDLHQAIPRSGAPEKVPEGALDMSVAHDIASGIAAAAHVGRHLAEAQMAQSAGNKASVVFNIQHAVHHVTEIAHCLSELCADLPRRLPAVGREMEVLTAAASPPPGPPPDAGIPDTGRAAPADYDVTPPDHGPQPA